MFIYYVSSEVSELNSIESILWLKLGGITTGYNWHSSFINIISHYINKSPQMRWLNKKLLYFRRNCQFQLTIPFYILFQPVLFSVVLISSKMKCSIKCHSLLHWIILRSEHILFLSKFRISNIALSMKHELQFRIHFELR